MVRTRHMPQCMGQRGVTSRLVVLTSQYGTGHGDRIVLNRKNVEELLACMNALRKDLLTIHEKGGLGVIESGEAQITVYCLDSYNQKKKATYVKH